MKKSLLALAAITLASGAAFAGEADPSGQFALQIQGQRTRAEVKAETVAAVASGATAPSAIPASSRVQPRLDSTLDARTVREEARQSVLAGSTEYGVIGHL